MRDALYKLIIRLWRHSKNPQDGCGGFKEIYQKKKYYHAKAEVLKI